MSGYLTLLRLLPKNMFSRSLGRLADIRFPKWLLNFLIRAFSRHYRIEMGEVATASFNTFNEFFTRPLYPHARPIATGEGVVISPVDGIIGTLGKIEGTTLFQAKGISYSLANLVAYPPYATLFSHGSYMTFYLSPRHYHRIHAPLAGAVRELYYIPGTLYPVNPFAVENIPGLFTLNERMITLLHHPTVGHLAVVKVGATVVGKIKVVYDVVESNRKRHAVHRHYSDISLAKGEELGRFLMGSTVILLFEKGKVVLHNLSSGHEIRWGEAIGKATDQG